MIEQLLNSLMGMVDTMMVSNVGSVAVAIYLIRCCGFGTMGVWIGMFADWTIRGIIFTKRFLGKNWERKKVLS